MASPMHVVIRDGVVTNTILIDAETVREWTENNFIDQMWPSATLIDATDLMPQPAIDWLYDGKSFTPPANSEPVTTSQIDSQSSVGGGTTDV